MYLLASIQVWSGGLYINGLQRRTGRQSAKFCGGSLDLCDFAVSAVCLIIGVVNFVLGLIVGSQLLKMRGHYFAIGTLGLGVAAGEFASTMGFLGAGSGMNFIQPPDGIELMPVLYYTGLAVAAVLFVLLRWLYSTRFGFVMNAIRDNEDKAEAMGLPTHNVKAFAWAIAAIFAAIAGGLVWVRQEFHRPDRGGVFRHNHRCLDVADGA